MDNSGTQEQEHKQLLNSTTGKMLQANLVGEILVARIFSHYQNDADSLKAALKEDPYCLVDVQGVSLKRADAIAVAMGFVLADITHHRNKAVIKLILDVNTNFGNAYLPLLMLKKKAKTEMLVAEVDGVVQEMVADGSLVCDGADDLYLKKYYVAETEVAEMLKERAVAVAGGSDGDGDGDVEEEEDEDAQSIRRISAKTTKFFSILAVHFLELPEPEVFDDLERGGDDPDKVAEALRGLMQRVWLNYLEEKKKK